MSQHFLVVWKIEIEADGPEQAARIAQHYQRDPQTLATVYHVTPFCAKCKDHHPSEEVTIDLQRESTHDH